MSEAFTFLEKALKILEDDQDRLGLIDDYYRGLHRMPYIPEGATAEYLLLAERSVTHSGNFCQLLVNTPVQALYVDNFRRSEAKSMEVDVSPEWKSWQESRMDARQAGIYTAAIEYGHSFTLTERDSAGRILTRGLSPLRTVTLYEDPSFDIDPAAAVYIKRWPGDLKRGLAIIWDEEYRYEVEFDKGDLNPTLKDQTSHGANQCPVTRFTAHLDLEGRAWGVVEPMIGLQDRFNQTVFDLLVAQTYTSFEVRTVSGMAPPIQMKRTESGDLEPVLDDNGNPVPDRIYVNASRFLYAEDPDVKFGSLPGGKLDGLISSAELALRHISAIGQVPPHFLLGQIANISAEALKAAELALSRKVDQYRSSFGESWERVFRITVSLLGEGSQDDFLGEVIWRDTGISSLAQSADALGKFAENLGIPKRGLWPRVPNVSRQELNEWGKLLEEDDEAKAILSSTFGPLGTGTRTSSFGTEAGEGVANGDSAAS